MNLDPDRLVTRIEWWLRWADAHGILCDEACTFDDIIRDLTGDAYRRLLAPDTEGTTSAPHQAANTAYARALLMNDAIGCEGGDPNSQVDPVRVLDPAGRIVPRPPTPEAGGEWESIAAPGAVHQDVMQRQYSPITRSLP